MQLCPMQQSSCCSQRYPFRFIFRGLESGNSVQMRVLNLAFSQSRLSALYLENAQNLSSSCNLVLPKWEHLPTSSKTQRWPSVHWKVARKRQMRRSIVWHGAPQIERPRTMCSALSTELQSRSGSP